MTISPTMSPLGSPLEVKLPNEHAVAAVRPQRKADDIGPSEVLVVDDILTSRLVLSASIRQLGHSVTESAGGREALEQLAQRPFDLVLLDLSMPDIDGYAVLDQMKGDPVLQSIPVLIVSGVEDLEGVVRCIARGADDYLYKPFQPVLLRARVHACLERKQLWDELQARYVQLQQLNRLQHGLTEMIVHDLRTPLTSVLTGLMTMERIGSLDDLQTEVLDMAVSGSQALLALVNDLLNISKLDDGSFRLEYEGGIVTRVLLEQAADQVAALAGDKNISIVIDAPPDLPILCADRAQLTRVLVNLLGNAIKFTPGSGVIHLSARALLNADQLVFGVKDSGEGIPEDQFEHIFERFGQVESRRAGRKMSTGLGLTYCKLIAEAHGGCIWVESEVSRGSTFSFVIPVRPPEPRTAQETLCSEPTGGC